MLPNNFSFDVMQDHEAMLLIEWAKKEGWNPGLSDQKVARNFDPEAFIALRKNNELVGGGSIISYDGLYGFMGLFIMREDYRGKGLGAKLWHYRREKLISRLQPTAAIGMDGVFNMTPFYARGGFTLSHRDLRYEGIAQNGVKSFDITPLNNINFDVLDAYDQQHFPAPRSNFIKAWTNQVGVFGYAILKKNVLVGYGVARPCHIGYKIGPFFADSVDIADSILSSLLSEIKGELVQIDIPEPNINAIKLAHKYCLVESFGCARMYLGNINSEPLQNIYSVTSYEFG